MNEFRIPPTALELSVKILTVCSGYSFYDGITALAVCVFKLGKASESGEGRTLSRAALEWIRMAVTDHAESSAAGCNCNGCR